MLTQMECFNLWMTQSCFLRLRDLSAFWVSSLLSLTRSVKTKISMGLLTVDIIPGWWDDVCQVWTKKLAWRNRSLLQLQWRLHTTEFHWSDEQQLLFRNDPISCSPQCQGKLVDGCLVQRWEVLRNVVPYTNPTRVFKTNLSHRAEDYMPFLTVVEEEFQIAYLFMSEVANQIFRFFQKATGNHDYLYWVFGLLTAWDSSIGMVTLDK